MKLNKKIVLSIIAVLTLGVSLTACSNNTDNSVKAVKEKKTLVMGTSADFAPMEFPIVKNGKKQYTGLDIFLGEKIAKKLGVKLKVENIAFPSLISELKSNKVDIVLSGMSYTKQRAKAVAFSKSYYNVGNVVVVAKKNANKYNTVASLKGQQVGAQQSSLQETIMTKQLKGVTKVTESSNDTLMNELQVGTLKGVVLSEDMAQGFVKKYPNKYAISKIKLTTPKSSAYSALLRKGDKKLMKVVNQVITEEKQNGNLDKMFEKAVNLQVSSGN
ncbi:transporter substrate-binding domain-containing protein [Lactobacillus corticis]|uniref:Amino acid ABC transporter substrate-binding protein n=1 Tax=Lactobacillus corticis TaxID=2201249 RepID=A0A916QJJ0_9LACO|nr:transporter substrate-binding domain-containing protein [Lactobacillus corticis]GFZ26271.1 amino acid ABC transporter substrate-binding protein [Lactobacillus corticis]